MGFLSLVDSFMKIAVKQNAILKNRIKLIRAMIDSLDELPEGEVRDFFASIVEEVRKDKVGHFISLSLNDPNIISYSIREKDKDNENKRVKTSLGRYLKRNFSIPFKDNVLSSYVNSILTKIQSSENLDSQIKELSEYDIVDFYRSSNDTSQQDECGYKGLHSCMTGEVAADYTELYALNPDKVKMITFGNRARALLWTTDDGTKVLDRYYPANSKYGEMLREWAERKGYVVRENPDKLEASGNVEISDGREHRITLKHNDVFPYMDTFKFGEFEEDNLIVSNYETFGSLVFDSNSGNYKNVGDCQKCGDFIPRNQRKYHEGDLYCIDCYSERFTECYDCNKVITYDESNRGGDYEYCEDCFNKSFFYCSKCGDAEYITDAVIIDNDDYLCEYCFQKIDVQECDNCGKLFTKKMRTEALDLNNQLVYVCDNDSSVINKCEECNRSFIYKLRNGKCMDCIAGVNKQLSFSFAEGYLESILFLKRG